MIRIAYITRASLVSSAAQSIQIKKMGAAFSIELGEKFILVSGGNSTVSQGKYHKVIFGNGSASVANLLKFSINCIGIILKNNPQWIYTRDILVVLIGLLLLKKVCLEVHHDYDNRPAALLFQVLKRSKKLRFFTISDALKTFMVEKYSIRADRITVSHDACDGVQVARSPGIFHENLVPKYDKYVVHVGSFNKSRGANEFVELARSKPTLGFVQIGGRPSDIAEWKIKTLDLTNISYVPHVDPHLVKVFLASADILFSPINKNQKYWWCMSPLKTFDYLESGIPILGSCVGSTSEILSQMTFIEYPPENIEEAKKKLSEALTDYDFWFSAAQKQAKLVRQNMTWTSRAKFILTQLS